MNRIFLVILALTYFNQCTENPFDRDGTNNIYDRHVVQGTLFLNDTASRNGIFIWLAGTGVSTFTDTHGWFRLQLPTTPDLQGLNGVFGLYYYLGNYRVDSSQVSIRAGVFEFDKNDIDENGKIINIPPLRKRLSIRTSVVPTATVQNLPFLLEVTVELKALFEPVFVLTLKNRERFLTSLIFHKKNTGSQESKIFIIPNGRLSGETVTVGIDSVWHGIFNIPENFLESGDYEVIPYIQLPQTDMPDELLMSFGEEVHELSYDYLKIPFKQVPAILRITETDVTDGLNSNGRF